MVSPSIYPGFGFVSGSLLCRVCSRPGRIWPCHPIAFPHTMCRLSMAMRGRGRCSSDTDTGTDSSWLVVMVWWASCLARWNHLNSLFGHYLLTFGYMATTFLRHFTFLLFFLPARIFANVDPTLGNLSTGGFRHCIYINHSRSSWVCRNIINTLAA